MPYRLRVDAESGIGFVTASGDFSVSDIEAAHRELWAHPDYRRKTIWDVRDASLAKLSADDLRGIVRFLQASRPSGPGVRAVYLVTRDVDFGVSRMMQAFIERVPTRVLVTRDYDEALRWLAENDEE